MKKIAFALALAVVMFGAVPAHAKDRGGEYKSHKGYWTANDGRPGYTTTNVPVTVPEPSSILLLGSGLIAVAGFSFLRRNATVQECRAAIAGALEGIDRSSCGTPDA